MIGNIRDKPKGKRPPYPPSNKPLAEPQYLCTRDESRLRYMGTITTLKGDSPRLVTQAVFVRCEHDSNPPDARYCRHCGKAMTTEER